MARQATRNELAELEKFLIGALIELRGRHPVDCDPPFDDACEWCSERRYITEVLKEMDVEVMLIPSDTVGDQAPEEGL